MLGFGPVSLCSSNNVMIPFSQYLGAVEWNGIFMSSTLDFMAFVIKGLRCTPSLLIGSCCGFSNFIKQCFHFPAIPQSKSKND